MSSSALARTDQDQPVLLSYEQAAERLGVSERTIQRRVNRDQLPAQVMGTHANGKTKWGIPAAVIEDEVAREQIPNQAGSGRATIPLTRDGLPDLAALRSLGLAEYADEWERRMHAVSDASTARAKAEYGEKTQAMRRVADMHGVSYRTLQRWYNAWVEGGPAALVPDWNNNRGSTCLPPEVCLQIREAWLNSRRLTKAQVYRSIVQPWYEEHQPGECPHVSTVRRFINDHIKPLEEARYRQGEETYQKTQRPRVVRDYPEIGAYWSADHRLFDVFVIVSDGQGAGWGRHSKRKCPCGSGRERRNCCSVRRPWLTMLADVGSACFVGWRIGRTPNAAGVCHAVRSGILDWGQPDVFCPDRGREFQANRLSADEAQDYSRVMESGMWDALGVDVTPALPYHPWSKPVESLFSAFSRMVENFFPGYCGHDAKDKPEQLDTQIKNGMLLFWTEFEEKFAAVMHKWNTEHICGDRDAPPAKLYERYEAENGARPRPDARTLDFLIQDERQITVRQEGLTLQAGGQKHRYQSEDLALYVGQRLAVRWDPEEPQYVIAYTPDSRRIAVPHAQNAQWGEWGEPNEQAARGARRQRAYLQARRQEAAGSTPLDRLDPTGSVRQIAQRQADQASATAPSVADRSDNPAALESADQAAREQQEALEQARRREAEEDSDDDRTVYSDHLKDIA